MAWSDKLEALGADNPENYEVYEEYLKLYARQGGMPRYCVGMWAIENRIDEALELLGEDSDYLPGHVLAYALAAGNVSSGLFTRSIIAGMMPELPAYDFDEEKREAIRQAVDWVNTYTDFEKIAPHLPDLLRSGL